MLNACLSYLIGTIVLKQHITCLEGFIDLHFLSSTFYVIIFEAILQDLLTSAPSVYILFDKFSIQACSARMTG